MRISDWSSDVCSSGQPARQVGAGNGSPAFFDQHLPVMEAGASLPADRAQRRDQHRARQRQLDERAPPHARSEEHTSELQSLMRISYAVFCLKKKKIKTRKQRESTQ